MGFAWEGHRHRRRQFCKAIDPHPPPRAKRADTYFTIPGERALPPTHPLGQREPIPTSPSLGNPTHPPPPTHTDPKYRNLTPTPSTPRVERFNPKLQALVYDILPSATAVFSYATGSRRLSGNEQFFVGAQTVVSLLQTTQIISDVCFMLPCGLRQLR